MVNNYVAALMALLLAGCSTGTKEAMYAVRPATAIKVDGVLDEKCWQKAEFLTLCKTIAGDKSGQAPAQKTRVALLWEPDALYIAWDVRDNDLVANYTKRDEPLYAEDVVEAFIDANGNLHDYAEFELSPRNVLFDGWVTKKNWRELPAMIDFDKWDAPGVRTAVKLEGEFWSAEMRLPVSEMRQRTPVKDQPIKPGEIWKLNLYRIDYTSRNPKKIKDKDGKESVRYSVVDYQAWGVFPKGWFHQPTYFRSVQFVE